jgi:hypothetical protein
MDVNLALEYQDMNHSIQRQTHMTINVTDVDVCLFSVSFLQVMLKVVLSLHYLVR